MKSKVLLIDDSVTIHRVIDLSIDFDRYEITKVFTKEDAGIKLQSEQFDFILLDVKLENIVVNEYVSELRQTQPDAKIILLVGNFDNYNEDMLAKSGADDYLVKPFGAQALNDKLVSEADMMNASIVERMAEADSLRDKDDYSSDSDIEAVSSTGQTDKNVEQITKESYLENLEEVQPDDLTENGYIEDDEDNDYSEFENGFSADEIEKSKEISLNSDNNEVDFSSIAESQEEMPVSADNEELNNEIIQDNADNSINDEALEEQFDNIETEEETAEESENIQDKESSSEEYKYVNDDDWLSDAPVASADKHEYKSVEDNLNNEDDLEAMNNLMVEHTDMVVSPAAEVASVPENVSDDYIMYDNLSEKHTGDELVTHVPDFPEMDMDEEHKVEDNQEQEEESQAVEDNQLQIDENVEETINSDEGFEAYDNEHIEAEEEPVLSEEYQENAAEDLFNEDTEMDDDIKPINEVKEDAEIYMADEEMEEEKAVELPDSDDEMDFSSLVPDVSGDEVSYSGKEVEEAAVQKQAVKEQSSPAVSQGIQSNIGGITVTISREEIISMLGSAIDRHVLESAVKEVIAKNMQEIVRNIVPSIAEKYIKEEIERLKKDE